MNFILKNIGWIALFIFFAIMLLIISANQKDNLVTNKALQDAKKELILTGSEVVESSSGVLTDLVKMLDTEETPEITADEEESEEESEEEVIISNETQASLVDVDRPNPLKAFFGKFKRSEKDKDTDKEESEELDESHEEEMEEMGEDKDADLTIVKKMTPSKNSVTKILDTPNYTASKQIFPGMNLQTAVGNTYQVGAYYLNLNNATFTQSLGVMSQDDTVRQLTPADKHGCFEVEVLSSENSSMIGKVGCVCKKWLKENLATEMASQSDTEEATNEASKDGTTVETQSNATTKIGDVHSVATPGLKLNNKTFDKTLTIMKKDDKVEQIGDENKYGCFQVRILTSDNPNDIGRVGYVCKKYVADSTAPTVDAPVETPTTSDTEDAAPTTADEEVAADVASKIGNVYEVSIDTLNLRDSSLLETLATMKKGDKLEQISEADANGCFQTRILTSDNGNDVGRVGYICSDSIEASELICE